MERIDRYIAPNRIKVEVVNLPVTLYLSGCDLLTMGGRWQEHPATEKRTDDRIDQDDQKESLSDGDRSQCHEAINDETSPPPSMAQRKLHVYDSLRDEIIEQIGLQGRRTTRGAVAIGAVVGYAVTTGNEFVIGLVPVMLGYFFFETLQSHLWIANSTRHIAELEADLSPPGSSFRYERQRGGAVGQAHDHLSLISVPGLSKAAIAAIVYVGSIVLVTEKIWPPDGVAVFGYVLTRTGLRVGYGLLSLLVVACVGVFLWYARTLAKEVQDSD